jgi:predicted transcriptional regulator of viral defense system
MEVKKTQKRQLPSPAGNPPSPSLFPGLLRAAIPHEEFDYQTLLHCLRAYVAPRDKVTDLLEKRIIIRVKKGFYVFGELYRRRPISREVIANLLYGPSYISLEYALQFHRLIPEAVETLTCVTTGRSRRFRTPVGLFTYRSIPLRAFRTGMDLIEREGQLPFLIATPEKALGDKLAAERGIDITNVPAMREYLCDNLRIPVEEIRRLDLRRLEETANGYRSRRLALLIETVVEFQQGEKQGD